MILFVLVGGLGLLALPGLLRVVGSRLPPRSWAMLCVFALVAGAVLVLSFLFLLAAPRLLLAVDLPGLAHICQRMLGRLTPGGLPTWIGSALLLLILMLRAVRSRHNARRSVERARIDPNMGCQRGVLGQFELIVLPSPIACAFSVPAVRGRSAQVVLTRGTVDALSDGEIGVVCAHEAAHLQLAHGRQITLAIVIDMVFRWWWPVRRSTNALRLAVERTADERAAGPSSGRRGLLSSALLTVVSVPETKAVAAFSAADGLIERINALSGTPAKGRFTWWSLVLLPGIIVGLAPLVGVGWWGHQALIALSMTGHCPLS